MLPEKQITTNTDEQKSGQIPRYAERYPLGRRKTQDKGVIPHVR